MEIKPASEQIEQLTPKEAEEVETLGAVVEEKEGAEPGNMKIDLHCHSEASADCSTPLMLFPARCRERGLERLEIEAGDSVRVNLNNANVDENPFRCRAPE